MAPASPPRLVLELADGTLRLLDPPDVYWLEAEGDDSWIRTRSATRLRDLRPLGELVDLWGPHGIVRIHRSHAVQLSRVAELRLRHGGEGWELKLDPPVNHVLPVGESYREELWRALGLG